MKRSILRHKFALWVIAALALASCSQDELTEQGTPLPVGKYPLELTADGLQAVATPAQASTRGTFFDDDWNGVTSVKVRVNDVQEKEYSVTLLTDKKMAHLAPAKQLGLTDESFWWTSTEEKKTVMAWTKYALDEKFDLPKTWTENDLDEFDIIGVRETIGFEDRNKPLEFQHMMAKVVINLRKTPYLEKNAENVKVQLLNMAADGRVVFYAYGLFIVERATTTSTAFTPYQLPEEEYEDVNFGDGQLEKPFASYTLLVVPTNKAGIPGLEILQIEVDDATYKLKTDTALGLFYKPGQVTTYDVTVKVNDLDVTVGQSIDWETDGASGSGEVELP